MKKYIISAFALIFVLGLAGSALAANGAIWSPAVPLHGWAWSSTIGWVSFNGDDQGTGQNGVGTSSIAYSVKIATSSVQTTIGSFYNNSFKSYAWSPNVGWVSFNATDVSPDCGSPASINLSTGVVSGWARVMSGIGRTDGWNGCINFSGTAGDGGTYGVALGVNSGDASTYGKFSGLTWGDTNVGWLSFAGVVCPGCVGQQDTQPNVATCTVIPSSSVSPGTQVTFTASAPSSGWATPYSYAWSNGCSGTSQTCVISSPTNGLKPTVVISDSGTNTSSPLCPTISISGPNPNATVTCSPSTPVSAASQTYSVTSTGLNAPLSYLWTGGGSTTTMTYNYSVTPQVKVTGSNGYQAGSCGALTVPPVGGTGNLKLMIGHTNDDLPTGDYSVGTYQTLRIAQGKLFQLQWNRKAGYKSCSSSVDSGSSWGWSVSDAPTIDSSEKNTSVNSGTNQVGKYVFQLSCYMTIDKSDAPDTSSATLYLTTSGAEEI